METSTNESKSKEIYTEVHDRDQFLAILKENPGIMVFKFGADWCAPCQTIKTMLNNILLIHQIMFYVLI